MRLSTFVSAAALMLGLAVMVPSTIAASSTSVTRHRDCIMTCRYGNCQATGNPCHCYCDSQGYPYCWCASGW